MDAPVRTSPRRAVVERAVQAWVAQLVDVSGRNRLLFHRDQRAGTLTLPWDDHATAGSVAVDDLLAGRVVRLRQLFDDPDARADAARRARRIHAVDIANYEEKGIRTLRLAVGLASWPEPSAPTRPSAPVLLYPLALHPEGRLGDEWVLRTAGPPALNDTLVHYLATVRGLELDEDGLAYEEDDLDPEPLEVLRAVEKACIDIDGFAVDPRVVVANFSYLKLPMIRDLQRNVDALASHDLVAAMAGDESARAALRAEAALAGAPPSAAEPDDEFLVLDADSSQQAAIDRVRRGESLVIQGPPGTGKSQTIANLIAALAADGRRVLFVAEKRAAIDAVLKNLRRVGLADLVLDVHGGVTKRAVAAQLGASLAAVGEVPMVDHAGLAAALLRRRAEVDAYAGALHEVRSPYGISAYQALVAVAGTPPAAQIAVRFYGSQLDRFDAGTVERVGDQLAELVRLGALARRADGCMWVGAAVRSSDDALRVGELVTSLRTELLPWAAGSLPALAAQLGIDPPDTPAGAAELADLLAATDRTLETARPDVYDLDLPELGRAAAGLWLRGSTRRARRALRSVQLPSSPRSVAAVVAMAEQAEAQRTAWQALGADRPPARLPGTVDDTIARLRRLDAELEELSRFLPGTGELGYWGLAELPAVLDRLDRERGVLAQLPRVAEIEAELLERGVWPLVDRLVATRADAATAEAMLVHAVATSVLERLGAEVPELASFTSGGHDHVVSEYRRVDVELVQRTPQRVRRAVAEAAVRVMNDHPEQTALVRSEAAKKTRHRSVRALLDAAPDVIGALTPCWAISPLLAAELLPIDGMFDVVVFDEASQILPHDAVAALARARQVVITGDARQLPPTTFFDVGDGDAGDADEGPEGADSLVRGFESILDVAGALLGGTSLRWHYRSEDERLIAFSNTHLYGRSLRTFPGSAGADCLQAVQVAVALGEEPIEAEIRRAVAEVLRHAEERPDESLGVITFGLAHAVRLEEALRDARRSRPELDAFFAEERRERFFVKNLERVQGDERDAVILSVGYGARTADGSLRHAFGPLNQQGGERRLNVAITRARRRVLVLSTFDGREIDSSRSAATGVELLGRYLRYVASRGEDLGAGSLEVPAPDALERAIAARLADAGIPLATGFGVGAERIAMVALDPRTGRPVLSIETDGPLYAAGGPARDRDRLRPQVLELRFPAVHRIWTLAWFRDPDTEAERVHDAWLRALEAEQDDEDRGRGRAPEVAGDPGRVVPGGEVDASPPSPSTGAPLRGPRPPLEPGLPIDEYTQEQLVALVRWIGSDTRLRTDEQFVQEAMRELGFRRRGVRIVDAIEEAIARERAGDLGEAPTG